MDQKISERAKRYTIRRKRRQIWKKMMSVLGCVVVFCTTYALILPAITLDQGPNCGIEEHQHDSTCYLLSELEQTLVCQLPEIEGHLHDDVCYEQTEVYICGLDEGTGHSHDENCYTENEYLNCEFEEIDAHVHDDICYNEEQELICEIEETEGHSHADGCYIKEDVLTCELEESEGHIHTDGCLGIETVLMCTQAEEEGHSHHDACYEASETELILICQKAEHIHTKDCVHEEESEAETIEETELTREAERESLSELASEAESEPESESVSEATQEESESEGPEETKPTSEAESESVSEPEIESASEPENESVPEESESEELGETEPTSEAASETTNESASEPEAEANESEVVEEPEDDQSIECCTPSNATEDPDLWEAEVAGLHLDELESWADRVLEIAKSQLGYQESDENYIIDDNGVYRGYTRYGDWYGDSYADWNTLFLAFCLSYAEIPDEKFPFTNESADWVELLTEYELYHTDYSLLKPGDIIYFDHDKDKIADHTGLVTSIEEDGVIKTIEGDIEDKVQALSYISGDPRILGFGAVPEREEEKPEIPLVEIELNAKVYRDATYEEYADDNTVITISGKLPEGVIAKAYPVEVEIEGMVVICAYDISLYLADGILYEPTKENLVSVNFHSEDIANASEEELGIHYIPEDGEPEKMENTNVSEEGISFEAKHFSVYAVTQEPLVTDKLSLYYNNQTDAFIRDPAYSKYYNANSPIGTAGSFHLVGFGTVNLGTHTNGNVLAHTLKAGSNFGTNNYPDELSYAQNYTQINGGSASKEEHVFVLGSNHQISLVDNGNAFSVNGQKLDRPRNLVKDTDTATAPFIDLARVKEEISQISAKISTYSTLNQANGVTYDGADQNNRSLTLKNPDSVGAITFRASTISSISSNPLRVKGFSSGYDGTMVINVDCEGVTEVTMPDAMIFIDGIEQGTNEVTEFDNGKVIWNFINANGVTINTKRMTGMVVAPGATVNITQNLNGTVVAENINVKAESHRTDFTGKVVDPKEPVDPDEYYITVQKIRIGYVGTTLSGAQFDLYQYGASGWSKVNTEPLTTGTNGIVTLRQLEEDTYYKLVETKAPAGYILPEGYYSFWIKSNSNVNQPVYVPSDFSAEDLENGAIWFVANEKMNENETTSLTINKVWLTQEGLPLGNPGTTSITANVYQIPDGNTEAKTFYKTVTITEAGEWTAIVENLPLCGRVEGSETLIGYTYVVEEVAVNGFIVTYEESKDTVTIINTQIPYTCVLPETGGIGTQWYIICGLLFIAAAVMGGYGLRRRSERRFED